MNLENFLKHIEPIVIDEEEDTDNLIDGMIFHSTELDYESKKDWLHDYIQKEFGINVPRKKCCHNHIAPFDFVCNVVFQTVQSVLVMANRDGGKTWNFAIIHALNLRFYDGCESLSVGAVESQAKKCFGYYKRFIKSPSFAKYYKEPLLTYSELTNGSNITFIPGTTNALNSPHVHKAFFDEVELTKWEALQEFFSITKSEGELKATDVLGSTRKYSYGVMQMLINAINSNQMYGWEIYQWCIWEVAAPFEMKEEWRNIVKKDRDGNEITFYDVARPFASKTEGFYPIDDVVKKFGSMSYDTWITQWECKEPSREGLVYGVEFDDRDILLKPWTYQPDFLTYEGQDFGDTDPMAGLWYQKLSVEEARKYPELGILPPDGYIMVLFAEAYINKMSASKYAKTYLIPNQYKYNTVKHIYDPAGAGFAREMKEAEDEQGRRVKVMRNVKSKIDQRIQLIKTWHENHRIKVSPVCVNYIREKKSYHYIPDTDKIADEDNHTQDAEGYIFWDMFGEKEDDKAKVHGMPIMISSKSRII